MNVNFNCQIHNILGLETMTEQAQLHEQARS